MAFPLEKYRFYKQGNKIYAVSTYCGRTVRGSAKCADEDQFDEDKGRKLAAARCNVKVCEKRRNRASDKLIEAINKLDDAMAEYNRMKQYFEDSTDLLIEATEELEELEKTY